MPRNFEIIYPVEDLDYFAYTVKKNGWAQVRIHSRGKEYEVYLVTLQGVYDELADQLERNDSVCVVNTLVLKKLDLDSIEEAIEKLVASGEIRQMKAEVA